MGIKRGNFENIGLGALAQGINPNYHHHASVAGGLGALASGMKAYAAGWDTIADGLRVWGGIYTDIGKKAVEADAQNKENRRKYCEVARNFRTEVAKSGLTENDPDYWALYDNVKRWKWRVDHQSLFGVYSSPQPTAKLTDSQKTKRRTALGLKEGVDDRTGRGFGYSLDWDGEEN